MEEMRENPTTGRKLKIVLTLFFVLALTSLTVFFVHEYMAGHFKNKETLLDYISSYGIYGPLALTVLQCIKVVYTVIPGALGCIVGATLFGTLKGFICSYIGICCGSMLAFFLSRKFGISFVKQLVGEKKYDRCIRWMNRKKKSYPVFLWLAITFPFSPDDFLCYFSGLTNISYRKFLLIILTAKPWTILGYSLIFGHLANA